MMSIERIDRFLAGQSFQRFSREALTRDAVVRDLEILSEASRHTPNDRLGPKRLNFGDCFAMGPDPARLPERLRAAWGLGERKRPLNFDITMKAGRVPQAALRFGTFLIDGSQSGADGNP